MIVSNIKRMCSDKGISLAFFRIAARWLVVFLFRYEERVQTQFSKEMAEKWLKKLKNGDGSKGTHWEMEQAKQIMVQQGHKCDPLEFWAALNIMYSDYYNVARKINMNTASFYAELAAAFLMDEDAVEDKLAAYYENVVQHG